MFTLNYIPDKKLIAISFPKTLDATDLNTLAKKLKKEIDKILGTDVISEDLKIVFDLQETDYVSSFFLRTVVITAKRVKKGNFSIVNANQFILNLFKMSSMDKVVKIVATEEVIEKYYPPKSFTDNAWIKNMEEYNILYNESIKSPESFWGKMAKEHIIWEKPFEKVLEGEKPYTKWFTGGKLNIVFNCLDQYITTTPDKTAIIWEGEPCSHNSPDETRCISYKQLHEMTCRIANVLKKNDIKKGDRVIIYMPMIPETVAAILACARIGAVHSVVFSGFSAHALAERITDCTAKLIITADGTYRRGSIFNLKKIVDEALTIKDENGLSKTNTIKKVLIHKHASNTVTFNKSMDLWLNEEVKLVSNYCPPEFMDSETELFILYTSGSTGKPKGIVHTTAGYLLGTKLTHKYIFDIKDDDIFWCTADVGWITGHSYLVYGPLLNNTTIFIYEGTPNFPDPGRFWKIIEQHKITILYTAPTAIRSFMKWGNDWPKKYDLSSLRLLGSVGEPINPQAWLWYYENIGYKQCPIVDTWWQTETGAIMISPIPGSIPTKPGSATLPFFGIEPDVVDTKGNSKPANENGSLIIRNPWPSMIRGIWEDNEKYLKTYWSEYKNCYTTGDTAKCDKDGYFWIIGREDDVLNVSGHRIGTAEIEGALVGHSAVAEAAAVGYPDDIKGTVLVVFVTLTEGSKHSKELAEELKQLLVHKLGKIAIPEEIRFAEALPKTRSGKIMRRLLKQIAAGTEISGDITTLEDINTLAKLSEDQES